MTWELFKMISKVEPEGLVFKSYGQMNGINLTRSGYLKKLKRFEKHGLVKKTKTANGHVFVITKKAKFLRSKAVTKKTRTDGFSTLIIFDIPEEKHNARDMFRRFLVRNGYTQIKESCFLSPFEISQDIRDLIEELKLKSDISIFSAKMNLLE